VSIVRDYFALTKPNVMSLLLFTTLTAMMIAVGGWPSPVLIVWTMLGGALASASSAAINMYLDRDIDALMTRTKKRPIPSGRLKPRHALLFGIVLGAAAFVELALGVNLLAAALSTAGILYYVFIYTMWLKRTTPQNIVIGGAAGAIPPLVGWAAVTGSVGGTAVILFFIVFFWTPPHFWALSLLMKNDYEKVGVPMLPVVRGEAETRRQILLYSVLLYAVTQLPFCAGEASAGSTSPPRSCSGSASSRARRGSTAAPIVARRSSSTSSRWPTSRCCSARWWPTPSYSSVFSAPMMTRRLARKNVRTGLIVGAICMFMFGITFVVAAVYVS
jgi:protoheme IX farnesyltransferase